MEAKSLITTIGLMGIMASIVPVSGNSTRSFKVKEFSTWFPIILNPIRIIENVESDIFCLAVCASDQSCKGTFTIGPKCTIFSERMIKMYEFGDNNQAVRFVRKESMVFRIPNLNGFTQAKGICSSLDGVLAGLADLQKLYEDGIGSNCVCGWIAEGYGAFPLTADNGCFSGEGVIGCQDAHTTSGWCKFLPEN